MLLRCLRTLIVVALIFPSVVFALSLQVNINGVDAKLKKSIEVDLNLFAAISEPKVTATRVNNLYDLADEQIQTTLQAKGYYNAQVTKSLRKISGTTEEQDKWIADFNIVLGEPTIISYVNVTVSGPGENDRRTFKIIKTPLLAPGKILTHADYENTKEKIIADFNAIGFLQADFTQSVMEVNRDTHEAYIKFNVYTGKQYVFGKVNFIDGLYSNTLLDRYIPFRQGDPYELNKLEELQENLEGSDLYSKIRFDPIANVNDPNDLTVPLDVRLVPKPRNRYTGSVGYGTDTNFRASAGWLHRRTKTPGHRVFSYVSYSSILHLAKVNYIIPGKRPATDRYVFGVTGQEEFVEELYSRKIEGYGSTIFKRGRLESTYGLNYFAETFHLVSNVPNTTKQYLLPNARWLWINAYNIEPYEYGTRLDLSVRGGIKNVLSSTSVIQAQIGLKHILPVLPKTRLIFRGNLGSVTSKEFSTVPPTLRYFTGGDDTVRGYRYNAIGPREIIGNPNSENIGGKYLVIASAELEHQLIKDFSGVVFFDSGNASMKAFEGPLAMGVGPGVRYKTPIGNLRLDVAKPLNTLTNKHWRVHFTFGTDF